MLSNNFFVLPLNLWRGSPDPQLWGYACIFGFVQMAPGNPRSGSSVAVRGLVTARSRIWNGVRALPWTLAAGCETWDSDSMS